MNQGHALKIGKPDQTRKGFRLWQIESHRQDAFIKAALNTPNTFTGAILNREYIGKTANDLVAKWNSEHPDDPVA